jgi:hypothetical protein
MFSKAFVAIRVAIAVIIRLVTGFAMATPEFHEFSDSVVAVKILDKEASPPHHGV